MNLECHQVLNNWFYYFIIYLILYLNFSYLNLEISPFILPWETYGHQEVANGKSHVQLEIHSPGCSIMFRVQIMLMNGIRGLHLLFWHNVYLVIHLLKNNQINNCFIFSWDLHSRGIRTNGHLGFGQTQAIQKGIQRLSQTKESNRSIHFVIQIEMIQLSWELN